MRHRGTRRVCAGPFENEIDAWECVIRMLQEEVIGVLEALEITPEVVTIKGNIIYDPVPNLKEDRWLAKTDLNTYQVVEFSEIVE